MQKKKKGTEFLRPGYEAEDHLQYLSETLNKNEQYLFKTMLKQAKKKLGEISTQNKFAPGVTQFKEKDIVMTFRRKPTLTNFSQKHPFGKDIDYKLPPLIECKSG